MANNRGQDHLKGQETGGTTGGTASNVGQQARDVASNVADKARDYASSAAGAAREFAGEAGERTDDAIASVGQGMSSLAGSLREKAPREGMMGTAAGTVADKLEAGGRYLQQHGVSEIGDDLGNLIRQYPIPSLLAVFGVGFLLGSVLRR
jgi:hypothetical protein